MTELPSHPAKWSQELLPQARQWLSGLAPVLDPMAGVGSSGIPGIVHSELEFKWAIQCPSPALVANACRLPFRSNTFPAAFTSPTFANRMADHHEATERCKMCSGSGLDPESGEGPCRRCRGRGRNTYKRNTYRHHYGEPLHADNTGHMQWGALYRRRSERIWLEVLRVLSPGALFVLDTSDHWRESRFVPVSLWHYQAAVSVGFDYVDKKEIATQRLRQGANYELRADHHVLYLFRKPEW